MNKVIFKSVKDRSRFLFAIKKELDLSSHQTLVFTNNYLPYTHQTWRDEDHYKKLFGDIAEFEYIPEPPRELTKEEVEFIEARKWYEKLPEQDKYMVKILINSNSAVG